MKYMPCLILLVSFFPVQAQKALPSGWSTSGDLRSFGGIQGSFGVASGRFTNAFLSNLLFTDVLDDAVVADQSGRLRERQNLAGGDYEMSLVAKLNVKHGAHSLLLKLSDAGHVDMNVSRAAFDLAMWGNKPYAGDTVHLSSMSFNTWRYQQFGIGWAFAPNAGLEFYALAGYVNGEQFARADLERAWLYTSPLGDTLSAEVKGRYTQSDTANVGFAQPNGAGASLDFGAVYTFGSAASSWVFSAEVRNLGVVQWKPATLHFEADSAIEFTGIAIGDLRTINEQFGDGRLSDSLTGGVEDAFRKGVDNRLMPGWFQAELMQHREKGVETGFGTTARWRSGYSLYGWFACGYRFHRHIATHAEIGYGGYGALQVGVQASFEYKYYSILTRIGNLESFVLASRYGGASGILAVRVHF